MAAKANRPSADRQKNRGQEPSSGRSHRIDRPPSAVGAKQASVSAPRLAASSCPSRVKAITLG